MAIVSLIHGPCGGATHLRHEGLCHRPDVSRRGHPCLRPPLPFYGLGKKGSATDMAADCADFHRLISEEVLSDTAPRLKSQGSPAKTLTLICVNLRYLRINT